MIRLKSVLAAVMAAAILAPEASSIGWPKDYEGVMLQGFFWDSYKDEYGWGWNGLVADADEIGEYFDLMWLPNAAASTGGEGYHPIYWFSNFNTSYGSEAQYDAMRRTFQQRGVGLIAEAVLNHRSGLTNWTDFPVETWRGQTMKIGLDGICSNDEVAGEAGQAKPTGALDTGEGWSGSRDLDHTNANVQKNIKAWQTMMLEDKGYTGFRLDFVKGYSPYYTKIYNLATKPVFCVGECWDGYDRIFSWLEDCGHESAAFDFPLKFALNDAFGGGDMTKLVWMADGSAQPAGMIHQWYNRQYSVTFVDNHDTGHEMTAFPDVYRLGAAYAFILCQPGTPCVSLKHWVSNREEIKTLIKARRMAGVTNMSGVKVLKSSGDCYMAEVYGRKGTLVVKVGDSWDSPDGYSSSQIVASGSKYCVWVKATEDTAPAKIYIQGNVTGWTPSKGIEMTRKGSVYTAKAVVLPASSASDPSSYFNFSTKLGANWDAVNSGDRFGAPYSDQPGLAVNHVERYAANESASGCQSWKVDAGTYNITLDLRHPSLILEKVELPAHVYLQGTLNGWSPSNGLELTCEGTVYKAENVNFPTAGTFSFSTTLGSTWTTVNATDRFGSAADNTPVTLGASKSMEVTRYSGSAAASCKSWAINAGVYNIALDMASMTLTVTSPGGDPDPDPEPEPDPRPSYTVYVNKPSTWTSVYAYVWGGTLDTTPPSWPGTKMEKYSGNVYSVTFTGDKAPTKVIFTASNSGPQTVDLNFNDGHIYTIGTTKNSEGKYSATSSEYKDYTVYYDNTTTGWSKVCAYLWKGDSPVQTWPGTEMEPVDDNTSATHVLRFKAGFVPDYVIFNDGVNNSGNQTGDLAFVDGKTYTYIPVMPSKMYLTGTLKATNWATSNLPELEAEDDCYVIRNVEFASGTTSYFSFLTATGSTWDAVNKYDRYGATASNVALKLGTAVPYKVFKGNEDAASANAWMFTHSTTSEEGYDIVVNFTRKTVTITESRRETGIDTVVVEDLPVEFYNLQGVRVDNPGPGLYIVRIGSKVTKRLLR